MHETTRHFTDNKLTGGQRTIRDINSELAKLQSYYNSAVLRRDEATKALALEISNQQFEKWQSEHLMRRQQDYKQQFEKIRVDIAALKSHMPMIGDNFILCLRIISSLFNSKIPVIQSTKKKIMCFLHVSCLQRRAADAVSQDGLSWIQCATISLYQIIFHVGHGYKQGNSAQDMELTWQW